MGARHFVGVPTTRRFSMIFVSGKLKSPRVSDIATQNCLKLSYKYFRIFMFSVVATLILAH